MDGPMPLKHATRNRFRSTRRRVALVVALVGLFLLLAASAVYGWWSWDSFRGMMEDDGVLSVNTGPSSSLGEEVWRMRLRRMHRRQGRLRPEDGLVDRPEVPLGGTQILMNASSSSTPPKLVSSGADMRWVLLLLLAMYTGVLHWRAKRHVRLCPSPCPLPWGEGGW